MDILTALIINQGQETGRTALPNRITCRLQTGAAAVEVPAESIPPRAAETVEIRPGRFVKRAYRLTVPAYFRGRVTVQVPAFDNASVSFEVRAAGKSDPPGEPEDRTPDEPSLRSFDEISALYQPYIGNIGA